MSNMSLCCLWFIHIPFKFHIHRMRHIEPKKIEIKRDLTNTSLDSNELSQSGYSANFWSRIFCLTVLHRLLRIFAVNYVINYNITTLMLCWIICITKIIQILNLQNSTYRHSINIVTSLYKANQSVYINK